MQAFLAASSQWRSAGLGGVTGLDYNAADVAWRMLGMAPSPEVFRGVLVMERAAIPLLNKPDHVPDDEAEA